MWSLQGTSVNHSHESKPKTTWFTHCPPLKTTRVTARSSVTHSPWHETLWMKRAFKKARGAFAHLSHVHAFFFFFSYSFSLSYTEIIKQLLMPCLCFYHTAIRSANRGGIRLRIGLESNRMYGECYLWICDADGADTRHWSRNKRRPSDPAALEEPTSTGASGTLRWKKGEGREFRQDQIG